MEPRAAPPAALGYCNACSFWDALGDPLGQGWCRFNAPAVAPPAMPVAWPVTVGNTDWCGQWVAIGALPPAQLPVVSGTAAAPTGTASAAAVMMGLGLLTGFSITPSRTGRVAAMICGIVTATNANASFTITGYHGTGTAPANGATASGAVWSIAQTYSVSSAKDAVGFTLIGGNPGLTPGTPVWFDLSVAVAAGGLTNLTGVQCLLFEL